MYGNKKEALGLSTHHLIGCKDSVSALYNQTFCLKKPSGVFLALRVSELGLKGDGSFFAPEGAQKEPSPVRSPALSVA